MSPPRRMKEFLGDRHRCGAAKPYLPIFADQASTLNAAHEGLKSPLLWLDVHVRNSHVASELFMIEALMQVYRARLGHLAGFLVVSLLMAAGPARAAKIKPPGAVFA
ncbi:MAG: hypothetical protein WBW81_05845, partial [Methylocella sp.]